MSVEVAFIESGKACNWCRIVDSLGQHRIVEPYMVYLSAKGKRMFYCYQLEGFSVSNTPLGWKQIDIGTVRRVEKLPDAFTIRSDFNPGDREMFPRIIFGVPKVVPNRI